MVLKTANKKAKHALFTVCLQTWGWEYASAVIPRITYSALILCQPLLFRRIIDFVRGSEEESQRGTVGALILATAILYLGVSVSDSTPLESPFC